MGEFEKRVRSWVKFELAGTVLMLLGILYAGDAGELLSDKYSQS